MTAYSIAQGTLLKALWWPKLWGNPKKKVYICIRIADSPCCTPVPVETSTTL